MAQLGPCEHPAPAEHSARAEARLQVLASGSSGNAIFVSVGGTRLLIDAGIAYSALTKALAAIDERVSDLTAVLVSHEHVDHGRCLPDLCNRQPSVSVLASRGTARVLERRDGVPCAGQHLRDGSALEVGDLRVTPFAVSHDAAEPLGFRLEHGDFALAVATDLGTATTGVRDMLAGCRVLVVEANHDPGMLWSGPYPEFLKRRIASDVGHLSNAQAAELLDSTAGPDLDVVLLAHLSRKNNTPGCALATVTAAFDRPGVAMAAAARDAPGELMRFVVGSGGARVSSAQADARPRSGARRTGGPRGSEADRSTGGPRGSEADRSPGGPTQLPLFG
jgi:phosphoribosyl 1,2-cyclic phosphodiesterase